MQVEAAGDANAPSARGNEYEHNCAAAIVAALLVPVCADAAAGNDLRDFRIGMPVSALPTSGYGEFACAADPSEETV